MGGGLLSTIWDDFIEKSNISLSDHTRKRAFVHLCMLAGADSSPWEASWEALRRVFSKMEDVPYRGGVQSVL